MALTACGDDGGIDDFGTDDSGTDAGSSEDDDDDGNITVSASASDGETESSTGAEGTETSADGSGSDDTPGTDSGTEDGTDSGSESESDSGTEDGTGTTDDAGSTSDDPTTGEETTDDPTTGEQTTGEETTGEETTGGTSDCIEMTIDELLGFDIGIPVVINESISIGDAELPDQFAIEFYNDATGTFNLAVAPENNYSTCTKCVRVFEDIEGETLARQYYQSEGTLTLAAGSPPSSLEPVITFAGVRLVEVTVADDFVSTPVPDGQCIDIVDGTVAAEAAVAETCNNLVDDDEDDLADCEDPDCDEDPNCGECTQITIDELFGVEDGVPIAFNDTVSVGDAEIDDFFQIEFYNNSTGEFPLFTVPNDNYATCTQCVRLFEDIEENSLARQYFQSAGTLSLAAGSPPAGLEPVITFEGVRLVEVTIDDEFVSTPVLGGECVEIVDGTVETVELN